MSWIEAALGLCLAAMMDPAPALARDAAAGQRLPIIGPAPDFSLVSQDGAAVTLHERRGKVVAVAFIYTSCTDVCPLLTAKMASVQGELGADFGRKVVFLSISIDPEHDTPEVLKRYALDHGVDPAGWAFLTGPPTVIVALARAYGVAVGRTPSEAIDHALLTTLVDKRGLMRVQYLGYRFDPEEFRRDLLELAEEP